MNMTSVVMAAVAAAALTAFSANAVEETSARRQSGKAKVVVNSEQAETGDSGFSVVSDTIKVKNGKIVSGKKGKCCKQTKDRKKGCKQFAKNKKECDSDKEMKCEPAKKESACPKKCGKGNKAKPECKKNRNSGKWSYNFKDPDGNPVFVSGMVKSVVSYTDPVTGEMKTISSNGEPIDMEKIKELTGVDIEDLMKMDIKIPHFDFDADTAIGEFPRFPPMPGFMHRGMPPHRRPAFNKGGARGGKAMRGNRRKQQKIDELSAQVEELKKQIEQLKAAE